MPRPAKCKRVCAPPAFPRFGPAGETRGETVEMSVEEYETIRLIDWEQMTQEECSQQMQVSRATVQALYDRARNKLAGCLVNGQQLVIQGGHYHFCTGRHHGCGRRRCCRQNEQEESK